MGEGRESDHKGRKKDPSPAQHPMPRAWAVSSHGSTVSFPSPHAVQKSLELQCSDGLKQRQEPGMAVLLVKARGQASQLPPAPPAPRGPEAPRLCTPVWDSVRPSHRQLASTQSLRRCGQQPPNWALMLSCGTQVWPQAYEEGGAGLWPPQTRAA